MPIKAKSVEDYQRIWSDYDKDATGLIPLKELPHLLSSIANSDEYMAGALMVYRDEFKKEFKDEEKKESNEPFRRRLIKMLEIPTYNKMTSVMYYDVLMKLSH